MSILYQAIFVLFNFPASYVIDTYGCRVAVLLGMFLTAVGMAVKVFINQAFWICVLGQVFAAIGQPFLINAPAKLAAEWFGQNERVIALTISVASTAIGAAVGFEVPTIFVSNEDEGDTFKHNVMLSLLAQAIAGGVIFLLCLVFFKNKPKNPPSPSALQRLDEPGMFMRNIKGLFANRNMMLLLFSFS